MPESAINLALGRSLALVLWGKDAQGADDVVVYPGTLVQRDGTYYLARVEGDDVELEQEWLSRVAAVPPDIRDVLRDCDFQLLLTVGDIGDEDSSSWKRTGLKWPT